MVPHSTGESSYSSDTTRIESLKDYHLSLLGHQIDQDQYDPIASAPIFTADALTTACTRSQKQAVPYGLLAGIQGSTGLASINGIDPRVFFNVGSPSSTFICGSQGSGKSHTLSCLLENCLLKSDVTELINPMTAVVFHYDSFISDFGGSPCEAAFLSSNESIKVRVLCSPSNIRTIKQAYQKLKVEVEPLKIDQDDLNTKRMLDLMAINPDEGSTPLYIHTMNRLLREMRIEQQEAGTRFSYELFKRRLEAAGLTPPQRAPLDQRLETLESFIPKHQTLAPWKGSKKSKALPPQTRLGTDWTPKSGVLTIVDLSCPCITPETACCLFNICLSIFLEQAPCIGRVVALDEAHKYMNSSTEASVFTSTLLSSIRLQRHLGVRVIVSTQEPTISHSLLDLLSTTVVHRFTSPAWLQSLKAHLAPASAYAPVTRTNDSATKEEEEEVMVPQVAANDIFKDIVQLQTGEALLFSPSGLTASGSSLAEKHLEQLGLSYLKIRVRQRLTADGGQSLIST